MAAGINYANFAGPSRSPSAPAPTPSRSAARTSAPPQHRPSGAGDDTLSIVSIAGLTNVTGNTGADTITANSTHLVGTNPIGAVLNLDGNAGGDSYFIWFSGASSSVINVHDTGALDTIGTVRNNLTIYDTPANDTVLNFHAGSFVAPCSSTTATAPSCPPSSRSEIPQHGDRRHPDCDLGGRRELLRV